MKYKIAQTNDLSRRAVPLREPAYSSVAARPFSWNSIITRHAQFVKKNNKILCCNFLTEHKMLYFTSFVKI